VSRDKDRCPNFNECYKVKGFYWGFCLQDFAWPECPLFQNKFNPSSRYMGIECFLNGSQIEALRKAMDRDG